jgi:predicted nuclease of predicted toxin-antitoxin system
VKILADENIPLSIIYKIRELKIDVISITEDFRSIKDRDIIKLSHIEKCYILTFDKDFGELVFKSDLLVEGVILLRFTPVSLDFIYERIKNVLAVLELFQGNNFFVVDDKKIRIRKIKKVNHL